MTRAKNGQIRGNDQGGIVLVSNVGLDVFNVIVLKEPYFEEFSSVFIEPVENELIMKRYPHVIENARITFYDFNKPEHVSAYVKEFNELRDAFHKSQQAVKYAMERADIVYSEGGLSVDDYTSIIEALQQAEI